jgi:glycosyltransferase involved in cell wall biosynthesis
MSQRPRRILRIITQLNVSGVALHAILLAAHMRKAGYETWLVAGEPFSEADSLLNVAQRYGIEPTLLPELVGISSPLKMSRAIQRLRPMIHDYQPDIVHTHSTSAGFPGRIAARLSGVPVVVQTFHTHPFFGYYSRFDTLAFTLVERFGTRLSDSIITLSEGLRRELSDTYHVAQRRRITVLPLGYDLDNLAQQPRHKGDFRAAWGIAADTPLIGNVGRLLPVKNHVLFLQAAAHIKRALPDAVFAIVGDGSQREPLEAYASTLGISDAVIFTGWQQQMAPLYSDLDVMALTSLNEGTPVPIIEALVSGCPVVATAVGGVPDLLDRGRFGKLVGVGDAEALAHSIVETLKQPPDTTAARQAMLERYSIQRLVQDLDSLYSGLLARKAL